MQHSLSSRDIPPKCFFVRDERGLTACWCLPAAQLESWLGPVGLGLRRQPAVLQSCSLGKQLVASAPNNNIGRVPPRLPLALTSLDEGERAGGLPKVFSWGEDC